MTAPKLATNASLDTARSEVVFSLGACKRDKRAADQASLFAKLRTAWLAVHAGQLACWDAQTEADALVAGADDDLDEIVPEFAKALLAVVGDDTSDGRYTLYFKVSPSQLVRPVLGEQLETIRKWLTHLEKETDKRLKPFFKQISDAVQAADKAVKARREANAENEAFRTTGDLAKYLAEVQSTRDQVAATLEQRRIDEKLPRGWPSRFFRSRPPAKPTEAEKTAKEAKKAEKQQKKDAEVAHKAKIKEAEQALRDLKKKKKG